MSYSDTLTDRKDQIRFMIGDTNSEEEYLSDGEINYLISTHGDNNSLVASNACRMIASKVAKEYTKLSTSLESGTNATYDHYIDLSERFLSDYKIAVGSSSRTSLSLTPTYIRRH